MATKQTYKSTIPISCAENIQTFFLKNHDNTTAFINPYSGENVCMQRNNTIQIKLPSNIFTTLNGKRIPVFFVGLYKKSTRYLHACPDNYHQFTLVLNDENNFLYKCSFCNNDLHLSFNKGYFAYRASDPLIPYSALIERTLPSIPEHLIKIQNLSTLIMEYFNHKTEKIHEHYDILYGKNPINQTNKKKTHSVSLLCHLTNDDYKILDLDDQSVNIFDTDNFKNILKYYIELTENLLKEEITAYEKTMNKNILVPHDLSDFQLYTEREEIKKIIPEAKIPTDPSKKSIEPLETRQMYSALIRIRSHKIFAILKHDGKYYVADCLIWALSISDNKWNLMFGLYNPDINYYEEVDPSIIDTIRKYKNEPTSTNKK